MPFYYVPDEEQKFDIEELFTIDDWIEIQKATGERWHQILAYNKEADGIELFSNVAVAKVVLEVAARKSEQPLPDKIRITDMLAMLVYERRENTPTEWSDGMPDPKAKDTETATT